MPELDQALAAATSRAAVTLIRASPANLKNWTQIASRPVSLPVRIVDAPAPSRPALVLSTRTHTRSWSAARTEQPSGSMCR